MLLKLLLILLCLRWSSEYRQACCSGELVPKQRYIVAAEIAADLKTRGGEITAAEGFRLLNALQGIAVNVEDDVEVEFDSEQEYETDDEETCVDVKQKVHETEPECNGSPSNPPNREDTSDLQD